MADKKETVDIDVEDLLELITKAGAYEELKDCLDGSPVELYITPTEVQAILDAEEFNHETYIRPIKEVPEEPEVEPITTENNRGNSCE